MLAFRDINPQAPAHVQLVPKRVIPRLGEAKPNDHALLGHLLVKAVKSPAPSASATPVFAS